MAENMEKKVLVPMTDEQHDQIKKKADEMGLPVTAYMRIMSLQGELKAKGKK